MVKRILNPEEFNKLLDDIFELFDIENDTMGHVGLIHDKESIKKNLSNKAILAWDFFVWGNLCNEKFDGVIAFAKQRDVKFGVDIFNEFIWLSKNSKIGVKLFHQAIEFAKENNIHSVISHCVVKHPKHEKVCSFYEISGFNLDSKTYILNLKK
jgi:hypothetical protein